jgi:predicted MarR family transcription regulator
MEPAGHARASSSSAAKRGRAPAREKPGAALGPIVSSAHLADGRMPSLSEFEFGLGMLGHASGLWMVRCMAAAGVPDLAPLDVLVVHHVAHRERPKTLADLCLVLDVEDTHLVNYAVKKLEGLGLVASGRRGKEKTISLTARGKGVCMRYRDLREALLVRAVKNAGLDEERLSEISALMRALSGHYDQGARAAASL